MKRKRQRRNSKNINLVELVRSRYHPYNNGQVLQRSTQSVHSTPRSIRSMRSNRYGSIENQPISRRQQSSHSSRRSGVWRRDPECNTCASPVLGNSPPCCSKHTTRIPDSDTSIPDELMHLLIDDTPNSDDEVDTKRDTEKVSNAEEEDSTDVDAGTCSSNTTAEERNSEQPTSEQNDGSESDAASPLPEMDVLNAALGPEIPELERVSVYAPAEEQSTSESRVNGSRTLALRQDASNTADDEEAGGDGHHNNSVIEIEITLTSGNDSNSEDDNDAVADEDSEDT